MCQNKLLKTTISATNNSKSTNFFLFEICKKYDYVMSFVKHTSSPTSPYKFFIVVGEKLKNYVSHT